MNYTEGTQVLDGWTIIRKLGSGSFGTVYQIERKDEYGICERSALKVIRVPQSPEDMKEILDEGMNDRDASTYFNSVMNDIVREVAVMVEMKNCAHIVRYEAHKIIPHEDGIGGDILIRMELLTSLPEYRRTHEMNEDDVIRMGRDLADALMYCERKGIIHRDIKPQNIFVTENGDFKLGDFGIARRMQRTTGASRKGTEDYMAPEVYLRRHYGTTVDIYSLGLVMYRYTNFGRLPFLPLPPTPPSFDDREQALQKRMNGVPFPPPAEAEERLSAIILKACAYDSAQRYRNAGELKAELDLLLSDESTIKGGEEKPVDSEDVVHPVDPTEHPSEDRSEKTVGGWTEKEDHSEETVGGWTGKEDHSEETVGDRAEETVGGFGTRAFSDDSTQGTEDAEKEKEPNDETESRDKDKKQKKQKKSKSSSNTKIYGVFLLFACVFAIAGALLIKWTNVQKEQAIAASIAEREYEESVAEREYEESVAAASLEAKQKAESEAAEKERQQSIAASEEDRKREESEAAEREAQKEQQMKDNWEQVVDQVFSSFVEDGREYMEMPISEITRVVEARGFEGSAVDGQRNFAYSGSAQYELKTDRNDMVKLSVVHKDVSVANANEAIYRFIEYEYQDTYQDNYYNAEMQSTLRKLDLPYAVYFGSTKTEVMSTLGITQEMQAWCQNDQEFDLDNFLTASKDNMVYFMGKASAGSEENIIAVGKAGVVFTMSFYSDGSVKKVGIGKLKAGAEVEAMRKLENIIDSWMYLDGYPISRISFEAYEALLLSYGCEEEVYKDFYRFTREEEKDQIEVSYEPNERMRITYNTDRHILAYKDKVQHTFLVLSGIPQEVVQILSETPVGMTEKAYFVSQLGDSADQIETTLEDGNLDDGSLGLDGNDCGNIFFYKGKFSSIDVFSYDKYDPKRVTPVGGLASSYLYGIADQKVVYDKDIPWMLISDSNTVSKGKFGVIYNEDSEDETYYKYGEGFFSDADDRFYNGEFAYDNKNGAGRYHSGNSSIYGHWAGDDLNGVCTRYDEHMNVEQQGIWFNGEFVGGFK